MNNRIKELAEEAIRQSTDIDGVYRAEGYYKAVCKTFTDKFAELLIKECADIADSTYDCGRFPVGTKILDHFGIDNLNRE